MSSDNKARDELHELRYNICLTLGYDDGIKGTQHCVIPEDNFERVMKLVDAYVDSRVLQELKAIAPDMRTHPEYKGYVETSASGKWQPLSERIKALTDNQERSK